MFNLVHSASVATRENSSKRIQQLSDVSDFSSLDLSKREEELIEILKEANGEGEVTPDVRELGGKIIKGTLWCGKNNTARSKDDLGLFTEVDKCCRTHDQCPRHLAKGKKGYGILNDGKYMATDCKCDDKFKSCLLPISREQKNGLFAKLQLIVANTVGAMFFSAPKRKCLHFGPDNAKRAVLKSLKKFPGTEVVNDWIE